MHLLCNQQHTIIMFWSTEMRAKSCQQAKRYIWHTAAGRRTKSCEQLNNQQMNQKLTDAKQQNFFQSTNLQRLLQKKKFKRCNSSLFNITQWHWLIKKIQQIKAVHFAFPSHWSSFPSSLLRWRTWERWFSEKEKNIYTFTINLAHLKKVIFIKRKNNIFTRNLLSPIFVVHHHYQLLLVLQRMNA